MPDNALDRQPLAIKQRPDRACGRPFNLRTVLLMRLTPNRRHTAAKVSVFSTTASTNRIRSSMAQVSFQTIGKVLLADQWNLLPMSSV
jgi:hypothetical protein